METKEKLIELLKFIGFDINIEHSNYAYLYVNKDKYGMFIFQNNISEEFSVRFYKNTNCLYFDSLNKFIKYLNEKFSHIIRQNKIKKLVNGCI